MERIQPTSTSGSHLQQLVNVEKTNLPQILVAEAMHQSPLMLPAALPVLQAGLVMTRDATGIAPLGHRCRTALVMNADQLVGIVTLEDINRAISVWEYVAKGEAHYAPDPTDSNLPFSKLIDICTTQILYAYTDETVSEALARMSARGLHQLPVVDRDNHERVLGLLELDQIALSCNLAATRKALYHYLPVPSIIEELPLSTP